MHRAHPRFVPGRPEFDPLGAALSRPAHRSAVARWRRAERRSLLVPPPGQPLLLGRLPVLDAKQCLWAGTKPGPGKPRVSAIWRRSLTRFGLSTGGMLPDQRTLSGYLSDCNCCSRNRLARVMRLRRLERFEASAVARSRRHRTSMTSSTKWVVEVLRRPVLQIDSPLSLHVSQGPG